MDNLVQFTLDLTVHKATRLTAVLNALGAHWNPTDIYTGEAQAHQMLYAHLDADQQATDDVLLAAGALPDNPGGQNMMLDPHADLGRRAWLPCPSCDTTPVYLLDCDINLIWVQCGTCLRRWWHDTGVGHPKNPAHLFDVA